MGIASVGIYTPVGKVMTISLASETIIPKVISKKKGA